MISGPSCSPAQVRPRKINGIIGSGHCIAVDGVFAAVIGLAPDRVGVLKVVRGRGMCAVDIQDMDVKEESPRLRLFKLLMNVVGEDLVSRISALITGHFAPLKFRLRKDVRTRVSQYALTKGSQGCEDLRILPFQHHSKKDERDTFERGKADPVSRTFDDGEGLRVPVPDRHHHCPSRRRQLGSKMPDIP